MADAAAQGPSGPLSGDQGQSGPQSGDQGPSGPQSGDQGLSGDQGPSGPPSGDQGPSGPLSGDQAQGAVTRPNPRKVREGVVVSAAMDKTAVVAVIERVRHPRYAKTVQRTKRLYAHDEQNDVKVGDRVRIQETRPLSKLKRWRIIEVLERAR